MYSSFYMIFQGYLLASHLASDHLLDMALYMQYYCLLVLSEVEQMGQVVVWREVFPTCLVHSQSEPPVPGYAVPEARWFMLVVGMVSVATILLKTYGKIIYA